MPTKPPLMLSARIYLLRFVVPLCIASLLLLFSGPFVWAYRQAPIRPQHWFALGVLAILIFCRTLNLDPVYGLFDLPLLLLEVAGIGYYIPFIIKSMPTVEGLTLTQRDLTSSPIWHYGQRPPVKNCLVIYCALAIFLLLEALLRMGSLILYLSQHHVLLQHRALTSEDSLKPYQIMFGRSTSITFLNGTTMPNMSTKYYMTSTQMKFAVSGRNFLLRVVLLSSLACMGLLPSVWQHLNPPDFVWFSMLVFIILHHLVSCLNLEFEYGFADLPALFFEITTYMTELGSINPWSYTSVTLYTILAWVIFISLLLEVLIWVGCVALYITQHVWSSTTPNFLGQEVSKPYNVLFGHAVWRKHFSGETNTLLLSRGLFATILILTLLSSLVINVFLGPIQETRITPTKDFRSLELPWLLVGDTLAWNVILATPTYIIEDVSSIANVIPLWSGVDLQSNSPCLHNPLATYLLPNRPFIQIDTFHCYSQLISVPDMGLPLFMSSLPNLLITVNFTSMGHPVGTISNAFKNSVQIMIGLTNDTQTVVDRTVSTTILPGVNLVGVVTWDLRQLLKSPRLSAFASLFDSYETILLSRMLSVYPDPLAPEIPLIQQSPNISTFRVFMSYDFSETRMLQDYRSRSVLQGFAQVGGLWTFLTGVFAAIFGSTILQIVFGSISGFLLFFPIFSETLFRNQTNFIPWTSPLYAAEENTEGLPQ
ncbi:uncharacterized protein LACBIDRAFT_303536 [Laccaria bicolor S238N-H82]|uniref:Predicted protein n=1 Tax=Laccaria bicolor (strain S238N-H82 / ATCC MYA-4686) TaxID=486041 RepID=B0DJN4_LACBS|nr:uncharacterized protein LACBIDRAFT_303536 [Laccaria bicolor S238N-H82]EDR05148.1 predicted protein [Laccaria bicolor S238N-H82]|eukprot:XP_001884113.1 predicted protein [Laccaria bicolor S238N-H82]